MHTRPQEADWKGRALRAEAAMDVAARIVSHIMSGAVLTEQDWSVQRYLEIVKDYRLFRYGRTEPLTVADVMAQYEQLKRAHPDENGEGLMLAFDLGECYDCHLPIHEGSCVTFYPHGKD